MHETQCCMLVYCMSVVRDCSVATCEKYSCNYTHSGYVGGNWRIAKIVHFSLHGKFELLFACLQTMGCIWNWWSACHAHPILLINVAWDLCVCRFTAVVSSLPCSGNTSTSHIPSLSPLCRYWLYLSSGALSPLGRSSTKPCSTEER